MIFSHPGLKNIYYFRLHEKFDPPQNNHMIKILKLILISRKINRRKIQAYILFSLQAQCPDTQTDRH